MSGSVDVDVWVRGTHHATTHRITSVPLPADAWTETDVRQLLSEMLLGHRARKESWWRAAAGDTPRLQLDCQPIRCRWRARCISICRWERRARGPSGSTSDACRRWSNT